MAVARRIRPLTWPLWGAVSALAAQALTHWWVWRDGLAACAALIFVVLDTLLACDRFQAQLPNSALRVLASCWLALPLIVATLLLTQH